MIINSLLGGGRVALRSAEFLLIAAISAVVFSGCKKERSFRGANPGDEIVFGGTAGSASGFRSSKTKGGDGDSSVAGAFAVTGLDASNMESCVSYDSDADETYFFDWEDFEGGDGFGGGSVGNEVHDASSGVNTCKGLSGSAGSESLSGGESGVSCGDGISGAYSEDRAKGVSSFSGSDAGNSLSGASDSDVQTKTEYSGHKENVGGINYERIDWKVGDKVKIYADRGVKLPKTECIYEVSDVTASGSRSSAELNPFNEADGHGLMWDSGNADFYALYPGNSPSKVFASNTSSNFDVTVKLPKEQYIPTINISVNHIEVNPDMELAAMMAVSRNVSPTSSVQLDFLPLMTTFRITIGNPSTTDNIKINKISLVYSPSAPTPVPPLSGDYTVKYDKASGGTLSSHSSGGLQPVNTSSITSPEQEISVNLAPHSLMLRKNNGNTLSVTLFAVPVQYKGLQLKINVTQGGNTEDRILYLDKKQTDPFTPAEQLEFEPYKKYDINVGVGKKWTYYLEATDISVAYSGGPGSCQLKSYKTDGVTIKPAPWRVEGYSETSPAGPFLAIPPAWLTGFQTNGNGVSNPIFFETVSAFVSSQIVISTPNTRTTSLRNKREVGTQSAPIDLSKVPVGNSPFFSIADGSTASTYASNPMNTANCYVVTRPGWYKIPVVYGNSLKNSVNNVSSYHASGSGIYFLQNFIRHDGNAITNPWIKDNSGINLNNGVAELLWQDWPILVQNIEFNRSNKNYIVFHVSKANIHEGNAVIALKDDNGTIVWSWHIWVYGGDDLRSINVKNNKGKSGGRPGQDNFNFLSENLGACYDSGESVTFPANNVWVKISNGREIEVIKITRGAGPSFTTSSKYNSPYYQYGRKDPMRPSEGNSNNDKVCYDKNSSPQPSDFFKPEGFISDGTASGANGEIANTIKNPQTFNTYNYMDNLYYNLWDTKCKESGGKNINEARFLPVTKSVYDPCPPGLCLSPNGAFSGFTSTGNNSYNSSEFNVSGSFDKGWHFRTVLKDDPDPAIDPTIFFPALGFRYGNDGALYDVGSRGFCWSGVSYNVCNGCYLNFESGLVSPMLNSYRLCGFVLRPVAEN